MNWLCYFDGEKRAHLFIGSSFIIDVLTGEVVNIHLLKGIKGHYRMGWEQMVLKYRKLIDGRAVMSFWKGKHISVPPCFGSEASFFGWRIRRHSWVGWSLSNRLTTLFSLVKKGLGLSIRYWSVQARLITSYLIWDEFPLMFHVASYRRNFNIIRTFKQILCKF